MDERETTREVPTLSDRDKEMLEIESKHWEFFGIKEQVVRDKFDMSMTRYHQIVNRLIDTEAALAHKPVLVKRMRRLRASRARSRTARHLGIDQD